MGLFSRRTLPQHFQVGEAPIPPLYPDFYREALAAAGTSPNTENVDAAALTLTVNIALNARRWFAESNDPGAASRFEAAFNEASNAARSLPAGIPDEMIAFLWSWSPRCHEPLRRVVKQMRGTMLWLSRPTCGSCGSGPVR